MAARPGAGSVRVFDYLRRGNTLVVIPNGEAVGFNSPELHRELTLVIRLLEDPHLQNLLVDLSAAPYFGSELIGAINRLVLKVRDLGGRSAVCSVSAQMRESLNLTKLDTLWVIYDTRQAALAELIQTSLWQRVFGDLNPVFAGTVVVVAVLGSLVGWWIFRALSTDRYDVAYYNALVELLEEFHALRDREAPEAEWDGFERRARGTLEPIVSDLSQRAPQSASAQRFLLLAAQDSFPKMLEEARVAKGKPSEVLFEMNLDNARSMLVRALDVDLVPVPAVTEEVVGPTIPEGTPLGPGMVPTDPPPGAVPPDATPPKGGAVPKSAPVPSGSKKSTRRRKSPLRRNPVLASA